MDRQTDEKTDRRTPVQEQYVAHFPLPLPLTGVNIIMCISKKFQVTSRVPRLWAPQRVPHFVKCLYPWFNDPLSSTVLYSVFHKVLTLH